MLDAGCGRGEFLDLLRERGVACTGVDAIAGMVERCRAKGHERRRSATPNDHLERLPRGSARRRLLGAGDRAPALRGAAALPAAVACARCGPGGLFVAETVNPHAPHALKTFWVDPTHRHPLFPEVMLVLCRLAGFASAYVFHPLGTGHVEDDRYRESEYARGGDARREVLHDRARPRTLPHARVLAQRPRASTIPAPR